ncbi:MAG: restriction endonuclease, partial [Microthrixaceae bacterium]
MTMLRWAELDPQRFERGVQGLLRAQNLGMVPIDGSGGDGGVDGMLRTADGRTIESPRTVFEVK